MAPEVHTPKNLGEIAGGIYLYNINGHRVDVVEEVRRQSLLQMLTDDKSSQTK